MSGEWEVKDAPMTPPIFRSEYEYQHGRHDENTLLLFGWHLGSGYWEYLLSRNVADTFYYPYTIKLKYSNNCNNKYTEIDAGIATFYNASNVTISYYYTNYANNIVKATNKIGKKLGKN